MIEIREGSIFESGADALVNPVNCVGVAGKGLALEFKRRFPNAHRGYVEACDARQIMRLTPGMIRPHWCYDEDIWVVHFATKAHWRDRSKLSDIAIGLDGLEEWVSSTLRRGPAIRSIAIPAIGCGLGGLAWDDVFPLIEHHFSKVPRVKTYVYPPQKPNSAPQGGYSVEDAMEVIGKELGI